MQNLKEKSKKIISKVLFAFLILSFVLFGISSFLLGDSNNWVAKIDGKKISYKKLEKAVSFEKQLMVSRNPNNENALKYANSPKFKVDVLGKIINEQLIKSLSDGYGIFPDRTELLTNITQNANFKRDGKFDHKLFKNILQSNGLDEDTYISMISNETINTMVLNSIGLVSPIDKSISRKLANIKGEIRYADLITISTRNIGKVERPKNPELETIYESSKNQFQESQKRSAQYIAFNKSNLTQGVFVTYKQLKEFYSVNEEKFRTEQERDFYHISFSKKEQANTFLEKLAQSNDKQEAFIELGKILAKKSPEQLLIRGITKTDSIPQVAQKVFSLPLNANSGVFDSDLGYHVVLVKKITEGKVLSFYKVKKEIKKQLTEKLLTKTAEEKINKINESLLSTNSLQITTKNFNLGRVRSVKDLAFLAEKIEPYAKKSSRKLDQFADNVFKVKDSKTSTLIESKDKFYAIFVTKITDSRLKSFDEVKSELRSIYYDNKKAIKLRELTKKISAEINQNPLRARNIAAKHGLRIVKYKKFAKTKKVKFQGQEFETSSKFLEDLFNLDSNHATSYYKVDDNKGFKIAILKRIKQPKLSTKKLNQANNELAQSYRKEFVEKFNSYIEKEYDLVVNQKFLESIQKQLTKGQ